VAVQLQLRHIKDTPEYVRYVKQREARGEKYKVSKLKGDLRFAQQLINTYYSKGREEYNKSGELMETTFKANVVVGRVHDRVKDVWQKTKWGRIKYSGTGAHVFPVFSPHRPFR
jgi:hypothetical protein